MISKLLAGVLVFGLALWGLNQADILWFRSQVERLENDRLIYLSSVMRRGESDMVKDCEACHQAVMRNLKTQAAR